MNKNKDLMIKKLSEYKKEKDLKEKRIKLNHINYHILNGLKKIKKKRYTI